MKKLEAQLNKTELQRLRAFLAAPERPQGTFTYEQVCGFLFAIASSPELVLPSEWLPLIFNGEESGVVALEEVQAGTELLMVLYNQINQQIADGRPRLPQGCDLYPDPMQNLNEEAPFSGWAQGFVEGHNYLEALWDEYTPESLDDELGSCLVVLSFFSSPALAQAFYEDSDSPPAGGLEAMAVTMHRLIEEAMTSYAHIGRAIYQALLSEQKSTPLIRDPKVSRNDPCPCGSGRKYKHCCLH